MPKGGHQTGDDHRGPQGDGLRHRQKIGILDEDGLAVEGLELDQMETNSFGQELSGWISTLASIRGEHPESVNGTYRELMLTNRQYAFARVLEDLSLVVAVNNDEQQDGLISFPAPHPESRIRTR